MYKHNFTCGGQGLAEHRNIEFAQISSKMGYWPNFSYKQTKQ